MIKDTWVSGLLCRSVGFIALFSTTVSLLLALVITIERLLCIMKPFEVHESWHKCHKFILVSTGVLAVILIIQVTEFDSNNGVCLFIDLPKEWGPFELTILALFLLFKIIVFLSVTFISHKIWIIINECDVDMNRGKELITKATAARLFLPSVTTCSAGSLLMSVCLLNVFGYLNSDLVVWYALLGLPLSSLINPILYTWSTAGFRKYMKIRYHALVSKLRNKNQ